MQPVLVVDGIHLWVKDSKKLLIASAMDGVHEILPIAFSVIDSKDYET